MPHSRKASNSSLTNRGSSLPVLASVCAMKLAACCCTALVLFGFECMLDPRDGRVIGVSLSG